MEIQYARDLNHNYLVLPAGTAGESAFAVGMLQAHTPEGIIAFEKRSRNNEERLFYQTEGVVSLANLTLSRKLKGEELQTLLTAIRDTSERLGEYLLDLQHLYLSAETVFMEPGKGKWQFICYPFARTEAGSLQSFLSELPEYVSAEDEEAIMQVYELSLLAEREGGNISRLLEVFRQGQAARTEDEQESVRKEPDGWTVQENFIWQDREVDCGETKRSLFKRRVNPHKKHPQEKTKAVSYLIPLMLLAVALIPVYIRKEYVLSEAGSLICSVITGLCASGAVGSLLLERRARRMEAEEEAEDEDTSCDLAAPVYRDVKTDERGAECDQYAAKRGKTDLYRVPYNPYSRFFEKAGEQADDCDCTVLLSGTASAPAPKLYGRNQAASTNIHLEALPLTVGSLGSSVDFTLHDKSVSRMHACIGKQENGSIYLKDLGSTNGTFLNGKRLVTNEMRILNRGDEVRFGAMEFEYI